MDAFFSEILSNFWLDSEPVSCGPFGCGHVNKTYLVKTKTGHRYIMQMIGPAFKDVHALQDNITAVTAHLHTKTPDKYGALTLIPTTEGEDHYHDKTGHTWRVFEFIEDGICLESAETPMDFYNAALAFGTFQQQLNDFPAETLHETIPRFHHTPDRFRQLRLSAAADSVGRKASAQPELNRILELEELASSLQRQLDAGTLPLRVTHNDTKLNNVLLHPTTRKAICILDLDTVMPGLSLYDFGDAVRFGAATAPEDTQDLAAMSMSLDAFRVYTRGFLESATSLTEEEIKCLPLGPIVLTLETACRFLKDYLDGDLYFKTAYADHNLIRARAQLKLAEDMIEKKTIMAQIVQQELAMLNK